MIAFKIIVGKFQVFEKEETQIKVETSKEEIETNLETI